MINNEDIFSIEKLLNGKKIQHSELLSDSFGINCIKIISSDEKIYIVKYYKKLEKKFNAIESETKNLKFLNVNKLNFFPKIYNSSSEYLIISYLKNDAKMPNKTKDDLLNAIIKIHSLDNKDYGFDFDTQIGGLKQKNNRSDNWVDFYKNYRLGYIYEIICSTFSMETNLNKKIEYLINNLENFIPQNPKPSLLHGDLWEGNILFDNENFVGFIDPGSYYGHNELEIAYLRWFNPIFIDQHFLEKYNNFVKIHEDYLKYEPIYQLYYSLLNVHLWDRKYINDVKRLINIIGI